MPRGFVIILALASRVCDNHGLLEDIVSVTQPQPKFWSGNEIRETFLRFFEGKGHRRVRSSSLVPHGDPTLLFTNAGMNQFKDVFLGLEKREYDKATSAQKCVRAGGKHNDLENVGFTKRHHTFFEMLGNFSFGDYFKEKAIPYAWELITSPEWFAIPKDKLYVTVFDGSFPGPTVAPDMERDEEAHRLWLQQGVSADRIFELGAESNFWAMGDTGPCGPCSEIHYDMGPEASERGHADCKFPCDCGRYVEIWNLVFMQFNRDSSGFTLLAKPSVDTGMGLERIAAVLQGVISNYDTDLFLPLVQAAGRFLGDVKYGANERSDASLRIIADHSRAATFLVADGVIPSNEGRGYVLRKLMRRALRHARLLQPESTFLILPAMAQVIREEDQMGSVYPELTENAPRVRQILQEEERRFSHTITIGLKKLEDDLRPLRAERYLAEHPAEAQAEVEKLFGMGVGWGNLKPELYPKYGGEKAFRLYDTFGLPLDFIEDAVRDAGIYFDHDGFEKAMRAQRDRARASWKGGAGKEAANPAYAKIAAQFTTEPCFYFATSAKDARVEAIITKNGPVAELKAGESGEVVLDRTVIYAESGGDMADNCPVYYPFG